MDKALAIPEIRGIIFDYCCPSSLAVCARVASTWSDLALRRLWRGSRRNDQWQTPALETYLLSEDPTMRRERLKVYLSYIRYYHLHYSQSTGDGPISFLLFEQMQNLLLSGDLTAPNAEHLSINLPERLCDENILKALLVPSLRSVRIPRGQVPAKIIFDLEEICPRIRCLQFKVGNLVRSVELERPDQLCLALKSLPNVAVLHMENSNNRKTQICDLLHKSVGELLSRANLAYLNIVNDYYHLVTSYRPPWASLTATDLNKAFYSLRSVSVKYAIPEELAWFLPRLENLRYLDLNLVRDHGDTPHIYETLSRCPKLEELNIELVGREEVSMHSLILLARSCSSLRKFILSTLPNHTATDNAIILHLQQCTWLDLASNLPAIERLQIDCDVSPSENGTLEPDDLCVFQKACPRLRHLTLNCSVSVLQLDTSYLRFPRMEVLGLGLELGQQVEEDNDESLKAMANAASSFAAHLCDQMPRLRCIELTSLQLQRDVQVRNTSYMGRKALRKKKIEFLEFTNEFIRTRHPYANLGVTSTGPRTFEEKAMEW